MNETVSFKTLEFERIYVKKFGDWLTVSKKVLKKYTKKNEADKIV